MRSSTDQFRPSSSQTFAKPCAVSAASARSGVIQRTRNGSVALRWMRTGFGGEASSFFPKPDTRNPEPASPNASINGPPKTLNVLPLPVGACTSPLRPAR
ncbi:MAG: hypothetical protein QM754_21465 [Tepidisphaeraceae bacterium]